MKLTFLGATRTTTGSMHLLEANGSRVLLECGLYQGRRAESAERNAHLPFDVSSIDAVVLSHAHIDHSGNIPTLCKNGFAGRIHCTHATRDLCEVMLADSARIQAADAQFVSKKHAKKGLPPVAPLYTEEDALNALRLFHSAHYGEAVPVADGITAVFHDAGHILGSATVGLDVEENGRRTRLLFSGDLGRGNNEILRDPEAVEDVDFLLCESTYGDRVHQGPQDVKQAVCAIVQRAVERGGKIIIPAFALARTQQIIYTLHRLTESRCIPKLPIFVDSPLSVDVTAIYRRHPECLSEKIYQRFREEQNPFGMANLTYIRAVEESMKLNDLNEPAIIISASGMCEAGRILHHLKNNITDERNTILMIGFCAANTLGARIIAREPVVNIFGEPYPLRAQVEVLQAFSGHADKNELEMWVGKLSGALRKIFVVHGDETQSLPFAERLRSRFPLATVSVPDYRDSVEL